MSTLPVTRPARRSLQSALSEGVRRHPLAAYLVLAFGLAWAWLAVDALGARGVLPVRLPIVFLILMGYQPTVAAVIVTRMVGGWPAVRAMLRRLLIWRVGAQWYGVALFTHAVVFLGAIRLYGWMGGAAPALPAPTIELALNILLLFLVLGVVNGEEIGWRGFALPRLQARYPALTSSLILGGIQTLFHAPLFLTPGAPQAEMPPLGFLALSLGAAVLMTWLYNNTRGSLLLAYLFHAGMNTWSQVFPIATSGPLFWLPVGLLALAAVGVTVVYGPARLSRQPLPDLPTTG